MKCPHCGSLEDKVIESRSLLNSTAVRRRRECIDCGFRFTSYERIEDKPLFVVKSNGRREPFLREKIERGIHRALEKRPVSREEIENIVNGIEEEANVLAGATREIETAQLGNLVLSALHDLDKVAYIRFASVYRKFSNLQEFVETIHDIEQEKKSSGEGI